MAATGTNASQAPGGTLPIADRVLETGASFVQNFDPVKQVCAHLNAFHTYVDEPGRFVETNHYCTHLTEDVRQCLLYDSPGPNARLIGIEYMVTPKVFETLSAEEQKLWHSHVYEVKSGMLVMPGPTIAVAQEAWEAMETMEMKKLVHVYGKVYHLWQTDRGDELPLGEPKLMTSFTADGQMDFEKIVGERDKRFGTDWCRKKKLREEIESPAINQRVDGAWKTRRSSA
ncbi:DUF1264-domain-containing protein [Xylaria nigripes]|nr:DUF1264-domain-containing protein [Xylaria nigripes]